MNKPEDQQMKENLEKLLKIRDELLEIERDVGAFYKANKDMFPGWNNLTMEVIGNIDRSISSNDTAIEKMELLIYILWGS